MLLRLLPLVLLLACSSEKPALDADGDGFDAASDCDDEIASVYPGAEERCDGLDNDCSGEIDDRAVDATLGYRDDDADGVGSDQSAGLFCPEDGGFAALSGDCDDTDPTVLPGAEERCDGQDNDCDGSIDEEPVDGQPRYLDMDGDGYGTTETFVCADTAGTADAPGDCDDTEPTVHPDQLDACDGRDDDCDGSTDEDGATVFYADTDADGSGDSTAAWTTCSPPPGWVSASGDCDDQDAASFPGGVEVCGGGDEDCDTTLDDADADVLGQIAWYTDADADSFGAGAPRLACAPAADEVDVDGDCDDGDPGVSPAAPEICSGVDEDCDGQIDDLDPDLVDGLVWYVDADGDSWGAGAARLGCSAGITEVERDGDCDDTDPEISPSATERCGGGDEDCDGLVDDADPDVGGVGAWYLDNDGDGVGAGAPRAACTALVGEVETAGDCDDSLATISPLAAEICDSADVDEDCDGQVDDADPGVTGTTTWYGDSDGDGDGVGLAVTGCDPPAASAPQANDCDDADATVSGLAAEVCDNLDNDCDGTVDDGIPNDGAGCVEPAAPAIDDAVGTVHITVRTGSGTTNGTDDPEYLCVTADDCYLLDNEDWNDNESGATDVFVQEGESLDKTQLDRLTLKTTDGADQWRPACVSVSVDGEPYYCRDSLSVPIGDASGEYTTWTDTVDINCLGCFDAPLTHGPIVGATDTDSTTLWYRTDATRRVAVYVAENAADLATASPVHVSYPAVENDFTDTTTIEGLSPDTTYAYELEIEGTRYGPYSFRTLPEAAAPLRVVFGSCAKDEAQPIFSVIDDLDPDLFVFAGDNHYGNTDDRDSNRQNYRVVHNIAERAALMNHVPIFATWDDHDYVGNNTDGADAGKDEALTAFSEYWANGRYGLDEVAGVFSAHELGEVLLVLVDDRYWRGLDDSVLGDAQEAWLFDALRASDATFKLVVSGSQWTLQGTTDSWAVFPDAQERFMDLLADEDIGGVVVLSGDVHRSELRLLDGSPGGYDLPELTSSPLANNTAACTSDTDVVACYDDGPSFVGVDIDTSLADPTLVASIYDETGSVVVSWTLLRSELDG